MVICLERGADLHMAQLMPLPLTVSCFSKIQIGFAFLVPAHLGSPRKMAVKRVCVCVCVCVCLASVKSRLVLPFWYRPTRVVLDKGPLNRCVCVCVRACVLRHGWSPGRVSVLHKLVPVIRKEQVLFWNKWHEKTIGQSDGQNVHVFVLIFL